VYDVVEPILPAPATATDRRRLRGYLMVSAAAILFAVNGTVSKVILASGLSSPRLAQVRSTGAFAVLLLAIAVVRPHLLRVTRRELAFLAVFGVVGLASVQVFYFLAIHRLAIGIALLIQYLAPLLVALWARYAMHEAVRRRIWGALVFALAGLALMVQIWRGVALDGLGVTYALIATVAFAVYLLLAERAVSRHDAISVSCYGFLFATLFWAVVQPWWSFPRAVPGRDVSLLGHLAGLHLPVWVLMTWMVLLGTIVPFALVVGALRHVSATRVGIVAMLEPVAATVVAYGWLAESLSAVQIVGGLVVLAGILLAQSAR
jgi:drug/metabolite transporter (DMT)-like permease